MYERTRAERVDLGGGQDGQSAIVSWAEYISISARALRGRGRVALAFNNGPTQQTETTTHQTSHAHQSPLSSHSQVTRTRPHAVRLTSLRRAARACIPSTANAPQGGVGWHVTRVADHGRRMRRLDSRHDECNALASTRNNTTCRHWRRALQQQSGAEISCWLVQQATICCASLAPASATGPWS